MANCSMSIQITKRSESHQVRDCYKALRHMLGNRHHFDQGPMLDRRLIDFIMCLVIPLIITIIEAQPNQVIYVS